MECINDMGGFRESAQISFNNACHAFSVSQNLSKVGRLSGVKKLGDKLNPTQPHKLSAFELKLVTKASGDYSLVNNLLLSLDMVAVKMDKQGGQPQTLLKRTLENCMNAGELAQLTLENSDQSRLPLRKRNALLKRAHQSINNLILLASDLENKTAGISPFLSMSLDFVVQGAPMPGLM